MSIAPVTACLILFFITGHMGWWWAALVFLALWFNHDGNKRNGP